MPTFQRRSSNNGGNNNNVGGLIQRCHRWRQNRKKYLDSARVVADDIERERLYQMAEHYGRMVSSEQGRIDGIRGVNDEPADFDDNSSADEVVAATPVVVMPPVDAERLEI